VQFLQLSGTEAGFTLLAAMRMFYTSFPDYGRGSESAWEELRVIGEDRSFGGMTLRDYGDFIN
jgi:hypothetical protein